MTINEYSKFYGVTRRSVISWLRQGYLPGSRLHEQIDLSYIPKSTQPPYTNARARKNVASIYASFVRACQNNRAILAPLYRMAGDRFAKYIGVAIDAGLIKPYTTDAGVVQYYHTPEGDRFVAMKKPERRAFLLDVIERTTKGGVGAVLEHTMPG